MRCGYPKDAWPMCTVCDGRIHLATCTAKMNKHKDCCPERHKMLYDRGYTQGVYDKSQPMWKGEK